MPRFSRRELFQTALAGAALSLEVLPAKASPLGMPLGCQTYPVRKSIAVDFPGTIKKLTAAGFEMIELCSPRGYADAGFGKLSKYSGPELRKMLADLQVGCVSSHFSIQELRSDLPRSLDWAKGMGLTQMMVPSLDGPQHPTVDDVKRAADDFNKIGEHTSQAGVQLGLHNEGFEIASVNGKRVYDMLFNQLDPNLVKFQFQCSTISDGFVAADYFERYPGRFLSMHVQDWSPQTHKEVAVGQGVIDWKRTFAAAKVGGIKNYFVEMEFNLMRASVPYLRKLQV